MKIIFLCGSLESGRDGVGDYVRRLSGELFRQGHEPSAIALNDQYISDSFFGNQITETENILVLRLPSIWETNKRFARAEQWINEFDPNWISLQFVPFAFQSKGLPFSLGKRLFNIGIGRRWHIMFHELWVGMNAESTKKIQLWGKLQKYLIQLLVNKLKPKVIHTQSTLYQSHLKQLGFHSQLLPLFSNIPYISGINKKIRVNKITLPTQDRVVQLVVFGSIHANAPIKLFASDAARYAKDCYASVTLVLIGRCGAEQDRWVRTWEAAGLKVSILGEQPPETISKILQTASFGIATTPLAQIEKSGTVAAMLEHGLSVICVSSPWTPLGVPTPQAPPGILTYTQGNLSRYLHEKPSINAHNRIYDVANILSESLSKI
jgi:hypothetical protein